MKTVLNSSLRSCLPHPPERFWQSCDAPATFEVPQLGQGLRGLQTGC